MMKRLMKIEGMMVLVALLAVAGFAVSRSSRSVVSGAAGPVASVDALEHSFGTIKAGTPLKHTFKVSNKGNSNLEIKSVSPSCGCTTSNFDANIAADKTGGITLEIAHTEGYRGEVIKTAEVVTNDPAHPHFTLTLKANFIDK
jgi:hypothetical protein